MACRSRRTLDSLTGLMQVSQPGAGDGHLFLRQHGWSQRAGHARRQRWRAARCCRTSSSRSGTRRRLRGHGCTSSNRSGSPIRSPGWTIWLASPAESGCTSAARGKRIHSYSPRDVRLLSDRVRAGVVAAQWKLAPGRAPGVAPRCDRSRPSEHPDRADARGTRSPADMLRQAAFSVTCRCA